ncbi:MAG: NADH-quinone oxidoreductase subunit D [Candidatus Marinimicrobia bacterium]|nr:NADH-quinone oxidoreductase subunit D [Candidatus Neomarinimicrobiota bacterium]
MQEMTYKPDSMILNMGPQHPSTHGVLRLRLETDGEIVNKVEPVLGYLHRTFEKHCENLEYPQIVPYTDRLDYIAAMNNNLGYVLAVEKMLDIELPERVEYIRVIMSELNRIASHLIALGTFGLDLGAWTPLLYTLREREMILDLFESACGARLLYNYMWIGGLSHDLPVGFVEKTYEFLDIFDAKVKEYNDLLSTNKIFVERTVDVGILPKDLAINYACTGPVLRGSGIKWDLRKDEPYSIYDRFEFDVPIGNDEIGSVGDSFDRYMVRVWEMEESAKIVRQALDQLPKNGDVQAAIPRKIKPPKGAEVYFRTEAPRGEIGFYIKSDGTAKPYRLKMRSSAFVNLSVLPEISEGWMIADLVTILGSLDIVLGEIDR